jgi:drug/metabolite transporter (DMT)-like permease
VPDRATGVALAVTSAAGFGVMPVLAKVVYDDGVGPLGVLSLRFSSAAVLLLGLALLRREPLPRGRQLGVLALLGGVGYVVESLCYFSALSRISAGLTALLLYLYPALVVVLSAVLLRRRPSRVASGCVAVATVGTALTIGPVAGGHPIGVLLGLAAAASYALYIVLSSQAISGVGPFATSAVVMGSCGLVYDALALATHATLPHSGQAWAAEAGVAVLGTVVAVAAFFGALALLGPADTAVLSTVEPVVSVTVAAVALGERLTPVQAVGGALVVAAVVVLARLPSPAPTVEVPLDAP